MKQTILLLLLCLLLAGCAARKEPAAAATSAAEPSAAETVDEQRLLVGVWRNEGQYSDGHDFVETMTLDEGGICTVHLDYQGQSYQTLEGSYTVEHGMLYTEYEDAGGLVQRNFKYTLNGRELTLETDTKTVTYIKID